MNMQMRGDGLYMFSYFVENLRTPARSSLENVVFYKRFSANRKQFTWCLKLLNGQFGSYKPGHGILLNER